MCVCVCVYVCMHVCVPMGQSLIWGIVCQSSLNVLCQQSYGCWVKTVMKPLPLCYDTLWVVVSQHPPRASPSEQGVTGIGLQWIVYRVSMEGSATPMILCAVLTILFRAFSPLLLCCHTTKEFPLWGRYPPDLCRPGWAVESWGRLFVRDLMK